MIVTAVIGSARFQKKLCVFQTFGSSAFHQRRFSRLPSPNQAIQRYSAWACSRPIHSAAHTAAPAHQLSVTKPMADWMQRLMMRCSSLYIISLRFELFQTNSCHHNLTLKCHQQLLQNCLKVLNSLCHHLLLESLQI